MHPVFSNQDLSSAVSAALASLCLGDNPDFRRWGHHTIQEPHRRGAVVHAEYHRSYETQCPARRNRRQWRISAPAWARCIRITGYRMSDWRHAVLRSPRPPTALGASALLVNVQRDSGGGACRSAARTRAKAGSKLSPLPACSPVARPREGAATGWTGFFHAATLTVLSRLPLSRCGPGS
jgi:hypothetical protein